MTIRLLLGDQLNIKHSWFKTLNPKVCYVLMEMRQETDYITHHIQKVVAFFNAMRQFKTELITQGHQVHYWELDDPNNTQNLTSNLEIIFDQYHASRFEYLLPDEYRLDESLRTFASGLSIPSEAFDTEHFMTTRETLTTFFEGKKQLIMEFFYRKMRKDFHLLMEGDQPLGGKWNFDKNNRNKWKGSPAIPEPYNYKGDGLHELNDLVVDHGVRTVGESSTSFFLYPASRAQALEQLAYFNHHLLEYFGTYQDAMHTEETNLFHSRLSFALNVKILSPLEVVESVITHYHKNKEKIELSQVEGFVRQIIGWREYMRGIYWREMPQYKEKNTLQNSNPLPKFYWTGNTKMNCLSKSITNTLKHSYAHHIQRLMITGNFALLAQVHPDEVDRWYLGVYADAVEWVQLPNTRGMSQWADGGMVATKPYVSAAAYINKMSNYCSDCRYSNKKRVGEDSCPFNSLYWNFLDDKKEFFAKNNRMAMMLRLLEKIPQSELTELKKRAAAVLDNPDAY